MSIRWTKEQEDFLRVNYPIYGGKYCAKILGIDWRKINTKVQRLGLKTLYSLTLKVCRKCNTPKTHQEFPKDKTGKFGISAWCKSCYYKHNAEYQKNPKNKEKLHIMQKKQRNLYKNNLNYVIKQRLRHRMWTVLKGNPKAGHTLELLGCSIQQFKSHLALRFQVGMTWENYGKYGWHIDHIRPCSSFDLSQPEEQRKCFHYTNLQPLWAKDNLSKKDKWDKINYAAR